MCLSAKHIPHAASIKPLALDTIFTLQLLLIITLPILHRCRSITVLFLWLHVHEIFNGYNILKYPFKVLFNVIGAWTTPWTVNLEWWRCLTDILLLMYGKGTSMGLKKSIDLYLELKKGSEVLRCCQQTILNTHIGFVPKPSEPTCCLLPSKAAT